jgi:hypothetical protein
MATVQHLQRLQHEFGQQSEETKSFASRISCIVFGAPPVVPILSARNIDQQFHDNFLSVIFPADPVPRVYQLFKQAAIEMPGLKQPMSLLFQAIMHGSEQTHLRKAAD